MAEKNHEDRRATLKRWYEAGDLSKEQYQDMLAALDKAPEKETAVPESSGVSKVPPPASASSASLPKLRAYLNVLEDTKLDALCMDHFPKVYDTFGRGTRRDEKINFLLDHCRRCPEGAARLEAVLRTPAFCVARDDAEALICYLDHVIAANRHLRLQGIRSAGKLISIGLEEVYVTLTATVRRTVKAEEALIDELAHLAPGEAKRLAGERPREVVQQVKVAVQEALADHPRLVVLGDPGCGKTTLLRYLALTYARDLQDEAGLVKARLGLDEQKLPVLLPLRDFARYLEANYSDEGTDGPRLLLDYLRAYFENQDLALPRRFFADRLKRGDCLVLLDGVDEVAEVRTRRRIARMIERFTIDCPGNRFVVTSRIVGYTDAARLAADYAVTTVRDFTDADIRRFVTHWNRAVEVTLAGEETPYALQQAKKQSDALLDAIDKNPRVRELGVNPLLLTVIALVQRYRAQLPERRAELYEEAVEVLLGKWDEAKGLNGTVVLQGLDLDAGDRRALLEPVALRMMEEHAREIEADALRRQLGQRFYEMVGKDGRKTVKAVEGFLQLINARSGLLAERGQGVYAFSHLTFQEYLAARAVVDRADYLDYTLARLGDSWWREVILLEAGYLGTQGKERATALVRAIMDCMQEPQPYHNLVLAAEALRDLGPARTEGGLGTEVQRRLRKEFATPLRREGQSREALSLLIQRRAAAAEALARVEGDRPGTQPAFWTLPYGEPVWCPVPAGDFWMGSERGDGDEKPVHRVQLDAFQIARVPVTNAQYRLFVEASGHEPPGHWENGRVPRGLESHPVVNVTWYDAMAYCKWLSGVTGKAITLPSEAQWEKAARGDQDRRAYPWDDVWDATKCNNKALDLNSTTPVGIFPEGASPYGCLDMAGNVWEWTRSLFKGYPYKAEDGREDLEAGKTALRVLRGGSFSSSRDLARCAYRFGYGPDYFSHFCGFRVVCSPSASALWPSAL